MTKRGVCWLLAGILVVALIVVLIPGTPFYVLDLFKSKDTFEGQPAQKWLKDLDSDDTKIRKAAIKTIGAMGSEASEAVPRLAKFMVQDPDREIRNEAALALSKMAPASKAAIKELIQALDDKEPIIRLNAVNALQRLKKDARSAIPALIKAMTDKKNNTNAGAFSYTIQVLAAVALGYTSAGTDKAVPALIAILKSDPSPNMQTAAASALGDIGSAAKKALPLLRQMLKAQTVEEQEAAKEALQKIEGKSDKK